MFFLANLVELSFVQPCLRFSAKFSIPDQDEKHIFLARKRKNVGKFQPTNEILHQKRASSNLPSREQNAFKWKMISDFQECPFSCLERYVHIFIHSFSAHVLRKCFGANPSKIHKLLKYLWYLSLTQDVTLASENDSGSMNPFFCTFRNFYVLGMIFSRMRISLKNRQYRIISLIFAISWEFLIFQTPTKSVDEVFNCWYQVSDLHGYSNQHPQNIIGNLHDDRLMVKNCWGGGKTGGAFSPPQTPECHIIRS